MVQSPRTDVNGLEQEKEGRQVKSGRKGWLVRVGCSCWYTSNGPLSFSLLPLASGLWLFGFFFYFFHPFQRRPCSCFGEVLPCWAAGGKGIMSRLKHLGTWNYSRASLAADHSNAQRVGGGRDLMKRQTQKRGG